MDNPTDQPAEWPELPEPNRHYQYPMMLCVAGEIVSFYNYKEVNAIRAALERGKEAEAEVERLRAELQEWRELALDALQQGATTQDGDIHHWYIGAWEALTEKLESIGWLKTGDGERYKVVPLNQRTQEADDDK